MWPEQRSREASSPISLLAILVTRPARPAEFLPLSRTLANIGQTFPPVAVLALAVPVLGFGTAPTVLALFLYGLLPIFENALTGLTTVPADIVDAAVGTGMTETQRLWQVEIPLALPLILAGVRISTVIAIPEPQPSARPWRRARWAKPSPPGSSTAISPSSPKARWWWACWRSLVNDALLEAERRLAPDRLYRSSSTTR